MIQFLIWACLNVLAYNAVSDNTASPNKISIAAVVNEKVISTQDLDNRIRLVLMGSPKAPSEEELVFIKHKVLQQLIDEMLQLEEAERFEIKATQEEIEAYQKEIEKKNNLAPGKLFEKFRQEGVDPETWKNQVRSGIAWSKFTYQLRSLVQIGKRDIDAYMNRFKRGNQKRYWLAEIVLPPVSLLESGKIEEMASQIVQRLQTGQPFSSLAMEVSIAPSAAVGGNIDWVDADQLPEEAQKALEGLDVGHITAPIKTTNGYHIYLLRGKQEESSERQKLTLRQIDVSLPDNLSLEEKNRIADGLFSKLKKAKTCKAFEAMQDDIENASLQIHSDVYQHQLSGGLDEVVSNLDIGNVSPPTFSNEKTISFFMVCERKDISKDQKNKENQKEIHEKLMEKKLASLISNRLKNIHRRASINVFV